MPSTETRREWLATMWPIGLVVLAAASAVGGAASLLSGIVKDQSRHDEQITKLQVNDERQRDQISTNTSLLNADRQRFDELERRLEWLEQEHTRVCKP